MNVCMWHISSAQVLIQHFQNSSNKWIWLWHLCLLTMYVRLFLCLSVLINAMSKIRTLQPKSCFFQPYNMISYFIFYFFWEISCSPIQLFDLQHLFWSRILACLWLLSEYSQFMLSSQCHIHISIHSHWSGYLFSSLVWYLTVFYIVSAKKFGNFERIH